jgi:hypothetical protein
MLPFSDVPGMNNVVDPVILPQAASCRRHRGRYPK